MGWGAVDTLRGCSGGGQPGAGRGQPDIGGGIRGTSQALQGAAEIEQRREMKAIAGYAYS